MDLTITTKSYLITVITKPEVLKHLIPNIKKLDITFYIRQEFKGGKPAETEEDDVVKIEMICPWGRMAGIMKYINDYYVKGYGAICYYIEIHVPA